MKVKVTEEGLTRNGVDIPVGETIEIDDVSGAFHVKRGIAVAIGKDGKEIAPEADGTLTPQYGQIDAAKTSNPTPPNEGEDDKLTKAIDGVLTKEPLIEEAQGLGVEFAFNATKPAVIKAAIEQGKGDLLLEAAKTRAAKDREAADSLAAAGGGSTNSDAE